MNSQISIILFFLLKVWLVLCLPKDDIVLNKETWMGEALWENDERGHGWDPRTNLIPPSREFIKMAQIPASDPVKGLGLQFSAFGKVWTLDLSLNTFLLTSATKFDVRNEQGNIISSKAFPFPHNCFYIGSVRGGDGESGLAAISTCKGIRGILTTNKNDYVIQPKGLHGLENDTKGHSIQVQDVPLKFKKANMTISAPPHSPGHPLDVKFEPHYRDTAIPLTDFAKESNPPRRLISELALIVDKEFQQKYIEDFPDQPEEESLILFLTETINWMQMWYVHSTFGYQIWFHLTQVVLQNEEIDYTKYPGFNNHDMLDQVCNWQGENHKDSGSWDHLIFMSNKNSVFGNRADGSEYEGLAILGGECNRKWHCVGVKPSNFQWSSWHRTVAHESGHEFGAEDDYWGESAEICMNGLMRRGVFRDHEWAHCSLENFETWYPKFKCLLDSPTVPEDAVIPMVPINIAFRAEAEQSSTYISSSVWGAWKATDGPIVSPTWEGAHLASCTQTMQEENPWIKIKIEDQFLNKPFDWIRIINRWDKHGDRLSNLEVRIGNSMDISKNEICFQLKNVVSGNESGAVVFKCKQPMKGKYISVQLLGKDKILTVCEIQVFQKNADLNGIMPERHVALPEGETCVNVDSDCEQKAAEGKCKDDEKVQRRCRKSCKLCVTECWDKAEDCEERKNQKQLCYDAKDTDTHSVCKKTCNMCGCKDTNSFCESWAKKGECLTNPSYMQTGCRKSCKTCNGKPLVPPTGCVDHHIHCEFWAKRGECNKNPYFMHHHCTKSCKVCELLPCMDYEDCKSTPPWECRNIKNLATACRKSCGYCKKDAREDLLDMVCYDYSELCGTEVNTHEMCFESKGWGDWMFENCKKFCGYCTPGHPGKIIKNHPHYKDGATTNIPSATTNIPGVSTPAPDCHDDERHTTCEQDAKDGRCKMWKDFMSKYCAKSCGYCGNSGICADDKEMEGGCPTAKDAYGCDIELMQKRCAKTCETCL